MAKSSFGSRLKTAFNNAINADIAHKLSVSEAAVSNYVRGRIPDAEKLIEISNLTKCSIHWLLTGEDDPSGVRIIEKDTFDPIMNREVLAAMIREIVRDEMASPDPTIDVGTADEFDLEGWIERTDDPIEVMRQWYLHDGIQDPGLTALRFSGWSKMTTKEKAGQLRAMRGLFERQEERQRNAPKPTRDTE